MRLSNKVRTPYYQFIFTLANITLLVGLIFFILQNKVAKLFTIPIDIGIIAFAILLYLIFISGEDKFLSTIVMAKPLIFKIEISLIL